MTSIKELKQINKHFKKYDETLDLQIIELSIQQSALEEIFGSNNDDISDFVNWLENTQTDTEILSHTVNQATSHDQDDNISEVLDFLNDELEIDFEF